MKYHISVKFLAILLAVVLLTGAVGSAIGIVALVGTGLYTQTADEIYQENVRSSAYNLALNLAHQYVSVELGGVPEMFWQQYGDYYWAYQEFNADYYYYTVQDWEGNVMVSTVPEDLAGATAYTYEITDLYYRQMVDTTDIPESEPVEDATPESQPATEATVTYQDDADDVIYDSYYDYSAGMLVEIAYRYVRLGKCTVTVYLLDGAFEDEPYWDLLRTLYGMRYDIFWVLGVCLVLFAACGVYLCCAAGRKPGLEEIRAGGLNRLPLDVYLAAGIGAEALLIMLGWEAFIFLIDKGSSFAVPLTGIFVVLCCLVFVAFCYAFVAQIKMKNGYWWRNSVIGRCLKRVKRWLRRIGEYCRKLVRMLPVIGRWLLALGGIGLVLLITYLLAFGNSFYRINGFFVMLLFGEALLCVALVCYCAYAFGLLLQSARAMAKGDLDRKIPTSNLYGAFREMADELNNLADAAIIAAQKQMKSERMKTELITNVSHDIKTPLTSIINYVDLLEKPHSPEEGEKYLEVLSRQSQRLKKLVDDLMDMSKASTGNISAEITRLDAAEAVNQALGEFSDKLALAQLAPVVRMPEKPVFIHADGKLVWRVMSNLLSNTVKYALPGTRVYIDLAQEENRVLLSLKNISREELNVSADELAERFVRGDASRNTEGSGLGLNIARSLMELQKGRLELTVDGDLFKVTLIFPAAE